MSDTTWPPGKTFGELTPDQRRAATRQAAARLQDELARNADAISAVLAAPLPGEDVPTGRKDGPDGHLVLSLTRFQAAEVEHGLSIDADDGNPEWGQLDYHGSRDSEHRRAAWLTIAPGQEARDAALYRLTSIRDIWQDNAASDAAELSDGVRARSMDSLVKTFIEAAGGPQAFSPHVRRWIRR
jgi:hypothetical protein